MKKPYLLIVFLLLSFISCSGDDDNTSTNGNTIMFGDAKKVTNIYAPAIGNAYNPADKEGDFVKFSFKTGGVTTSETDWDIAFRYATILVNGGTKVGYNSEPERTGNVSVYVAKNTFDGVKSVEKDSFKQDGVGSLAINDDVLSGKGVWSYNMENHYVLPIPGRILVFKTKDDKIVKMEVLSFYKDTENPKPMDPNHSYYTFRYSMQK